MYVSMRFRCFYGFKKKKKKNDRSYCILPGDGNFFLFFLFFVLLLLLKNRILRGDIIVFHSYYRTKY